MRYPDGDLRNMFDAFDALSEIVGKRDQERRRIAEIHENARRVCGNCDLWMKSSLCPKEVNVNGMNRGPSMNAPACPKFVSNLDHLNALDALRKENLTGFDPSI